MENFKDTGVYLLGEDGEYYATMGVIKEDGKAYMRNGDLAPEFSIVWTDGDICRIVDGKYLLIDEEDLPESVKLRGEIIDKYRAFKRNGELNR